MNKLKISVRAAVMMAPAFSQGADEQAELQAKYDKKVAKEFVSYGHWMLDYDKAREKAKAEGKLIFTYFSRSYSP